MNKAQPFELPRIPGWQPLTSTQKQSLLARSEHESILVPPTPDKWAAFEDEFQIELSFKPQGDTECLSHPSLKLSRMGMAHFGPNKKRKFDGRSECTHRIETAAWFVLYARPTGVDEEEAAFIAYHHDTPEAYRDLTPEIIVWNWWSGAAERGRPIEKCIDLITDPIELKAKDRKHERHAHQIQVANSDPTGFLGKLRTVDKLVAQFGDRRTLLKGNMPFGTFKEYANYLLSRMDVVAQQKYIPDYMKADFMRIAEGNLVLADKIDSNPAQNSRKLFFMQLPGAHGPH